jgi:putative peptidoglycan lipid II flippase
VSRRGVAEVATGIFASRIAGLVRERVAAHFLGVSALGDVFVAVFRGPNVVQNLLGEQALSASFIPLYARLGGRGGATTPRASPRPASRCSWRWRR